MCGRKYILWLIIIIAFSFVTTNCKKSGGQSSVDPVTLKVLEYKTEKPIVGASVTLSKCTHPDIFGCLDYAIVDVLTTDKNGEYQFDRKANVDRIYVTANGYSGVTENRWTYIHLVPQAWIKLHAKKINAYPDKSKLSVIIEGDQIPLDDFPYYYPEPEFLFNNTPGDTTINIACYGNTTDSLNWYILDSTNTVIPGATGQTLPQQINAFDTVAININY